MNDLIRSITLLLLLLSDMCPIPSLDSILFYSILIFLDIFQVVADGVAGADLLDQFERGEILLDGDGEWALISLAFILLGVQ